MLIQIRDKLMLKDSSSDGNALPIVFQPRVVQLPHVDLDTKGNAVE